MDIYLSHIPPNIPLDDIITQSYNDCPKVFPTDTTNLGGVHFIPGPFCHVDKVDKIDRSSFNINHGSGIDANCLLTKLQNNLANIVSKMDATSQHKIGIKPSNNPNNIHRQIHQITNDLCINKSPTRAANIGDTDITACRWHFVQNATDKSSCQINVLQDLASQLIEQQRSVPTTNILDRFLDKYSKYLIISIIILIILIFLSIYLYRFYQSHTYKTKSN